MSEIETIKQELAIAQARLDWLLQFIDVADVGDARYICAPLIDQDALEERLWNEAFGTLANMAFLEHEPDNDLVYPKEGWERRCIFAGIDWAIKNERKKNDN